MLFVALFRPVDSLVHSVTAKFLISADRGEFSLFSHANIKDIMERSSHLFTPNVKINHIILDFPTNSDPSSTKFLRRLLDMENGIVSRPSDHFANAMI